MSRLYNVLNNLAQRTQNDIEFVSDSRASASDAPIGNANIVAITSGTTVLFNPTYDILENSTFTIVGLNETVTAYMYCNGSQNKSIEAGCLTLLTYMSPYLYSGETVAESAWVMVTAITNEPASKSGASYIVGTQTSATGSWTGVTNDFDSLVAGQHILYYLPYAGSGSATLNLTLSDGTSTGPISIYYYGTTTVSTQFVAGQIVSLVYDGTYWRATAIKVASDASVATYTNRLRHYNNIKAAEALTASRIIGGTDSGYVMITPGATIDITYPILWCVSAIVTSSVGSNNYYNYQSCSLRGNKTGITLTSYSMAYIQGTLSGVTFTVSDSVFTNAPTEEDGYVYIPIGMLYSAYQINFVGGIPNLYEYRDKTGFAPVAVSRTSFDIYPNSETDLTNYTPTFSRQVAGTENKFVTSDISIEPISVSVTNTAGTTGFTLSI